MPKQGFYAVRVGREAGIYFTWPECQAQIKQYPGAVFKKFPNAAEAEAFISGTPAAQAANDTSEPMEDTLRSQKRAFSSVTGVDESEWIVIYSDGACKGNGREGSVAGIGVFWGPDDPRNIAERCPGEQTNNRAELIAIIRVLETAPVSKKKLLIKTDSRYSINCFEKWLTNWQKNGFHTATGDPVKNAGIIRYLSALLGERGKRGQRVILQHVKGHSGEPGNEGADAQANLGTTLPPRAELDWEALEAQARERTNALVQTTTNGTGVPQAPTAQPGLSVERPAKILRSSVPISSLARTNHPILDMRMRKPGLISVTTPRPLHLPLSSPPLNPDTRSTVYEKGPSIYQAAQAIPPPTDPIPIPSYPLVVEPSISQSLGTPHVPTSIETHLSRPVASRPPLKASKVAPPLVPVSPAEIDFEMYKNCLLEGEDWEKEIENL